MAKSPAPKPHAAMLAFEGDTADACREVRRLTDTVLGQASEGSISESTANELLLRLFILPDKIQFLHVRLNQAFAHRTGFTPIGSSEIKTTSSVGAVRLLCYAHNGGLQCSHT